MSYLSLPFAAFVLVVFLLFYLLPKSLRWAVLLLASLVFYGLFDGRYLFFDLILKRYIFTCCSFRVSKHDSNIISNLINKC